MTEIQQALTRVSLAVAVVALLASAPAATGAQTNLVRDIRPGGDSSNPKSLTDAGGTLFFSVFDGTHGRELWRSDGTAAGTTLVRDIRPGIGSSLYPTSELANVGGTIFFDAEIDPLDDGTRRVGLWRSDGTAAGTTLVRDIAPSGLTNVGGTLFFIAEDDTHGDELWRSDGTAAGTTLVRDIRPGPEGSLPLKLTNVGGTLFFTADDGTHGRELWRSDGTAAGTTLVRDIKPGPCCADIFDAGPQNLTNVGGTVFFHVGTYGRELWRSDGTAAGTKLVRDISLFGLHAEFIAAGGTLFFTTSNAVLWRSDGTRAGTKPLTGAGSAEELNNVGGTLFFTGFEFAHGDELWRSDGTRRGTKLVRDINRGGGSSDPRLSERYGRTPEGADVDGKLYFSARDRSHGRELWRSDGTRAGTKLVRDIRPGSKHSMPRWLTKVGGRLFFAAKHDSHGRELWTTRP